jgi:hypothetical protein
VLVLGFSTQFQSVRWLPLNGSRVSAEFCFEFETGPETADSEQDVAKMKKSFLKEAKPGFRMTQKKIFSDCTDVPLRLHLKANSHPSHDHDLADTLFRELESI